MKRSCDPLPTPRPCGDRSVARVIHRLIHRLERFLNVVGDEMSIPHDDPRLERIDRLVNKLSGQRCLCRTCGKKFNSTAAFDKHRSGSISERRCLTAREMRARGMALNSRGYWVTSKRPTPIDAVSGLSMWPMAGRRKS